jgi:uncharacterized protein
MGQDYRLMVKKILIMVGKIIFFLVSFFSFYYITGSIAHHFINFFMLYQILFFVALIFATSISMVLFEKKKFADIGLHLSKRIFRDIVVGLILPLIILTIIFLILIVIGYGYPSFQISNEIFLNIILSIPYFLLVGFNEEILFRGYIFQRLVEGTGKIFAIICLSLLFGFAHYLNPNINILSLLNIVLAGVFFSIAYLKTNSLWLPISLHFSWNIVEGMVYGFLVSGRVVFKSYIFFNSTGPEWFTGGDFGPEGGILATILITVFSIFLLINKKIIQSAV